MSLAFVRSLIHASPVAFGSIDLVNDEILYSSGKAEEMLGYSVSELRTLSAHNFKAIVHPDDLDVSEKAIDRLLSSKEGEVVESILE